MTTEETAKPATTKPGRKLMLAAGLLLIFAAGLVCGVVGTGITIRHVVRKAITATPDENRKVLMQRLRRRLNLTDEQQAALEPIVAEGQQKFIAMREEQVPRLQGIIDDTAEKMSEHLEPEQKERLDGMVKLFYNLALPKPEPQSID